METAKLIAPNPTPCAVRLSTWWDQALGGILHFLPLSQICSHQSS